ncbi:MAG TPA: thiamine phosphate synthase [Kiloniellaceae bacterium]|nr:thiamine phosphate synthase [Kiloniellaceae bacterium]
MSAQSQSTGARPNFGLGVYVVLAPEHAGGHDLAALARMAAAGGASLIQLRDKRANVGESLAALRAVRAALAPFGIPCLVNDRVDLALAGGADGVHLGQDDMPVPEARELLGEGAIIGLTVRSLAEAEAAPLELLDYVSIGGVFPTGSKKHVDNPIGLEGLQRIAAALRARRALPLAAISGITAARAGAVVAAGVDGVAVITAVSEAADPVAATTAIKAAVEAQHQSAAKGS